MTSSYLSIVSNNDELHIFGGCLNVAFMLKKEMENEGLDSHFYVCSPLDAKLNRNFRCKNKYKEIVWIQAQITQREAHKQLQQLRKFEYLLP